MFSFSFKPLLEARIRFLECEVFFFGAAHRNGSSQIGNWKPESLRVARKLPVKSWVPMRVCWKPNGGKSRIDNADNAMAMQSMSNSGVPRLNRLQNLMSPCWWFEFRSWSLLAASVVHLDQPKLWNKMRIILTNQWASSNKMRTKDIANYLSEIRRGTEMYRLHRRTCEDDGKSFTTAYCTHMRVYSALQHDGYLYTIDPRVSALSCHIKHNSQWTFRPTSYILQINQHAAVTFCGEHALKFSSSIDFCISMFLARLS